MTDLSPGVQTFVITKEDEALCENCGRCCELKVKEGDSYRLTGRFCSHFTRTPSGKGYCYIYKKKNGALLGNRNVCIPSAIAVLFGDLPPDCPYAKRVKGYKTRVIDWMGEQCQP